ncbi:unnamed protein product [Parnassius mnemosyne]|uniref:ZAD domain-containing protein n=1 Tax=Parnassius mnemosyne TaxID=213953 RepID=A0AAV1LB34_9NEOP
MATISIPRIFQNLIDKKNFSCCALCLRTEREVQMTTPLMFRKVLAALDHSDFEVDRICNWCEARAATVARFVDMVDLALEVQGVLKKVNKTNKKMAVEGVVVGSDTLEEKERAEKAQEMNHAIQEIETVIIEDETPNSKHPTILPVPQQSQNNPLGNISSVTSMKSVESTLSNSSSFNVAIGADGFLYILPSSDVPIIPQQLISQQLTSQQLETCSNVSQINSVNNGVITSAEKRTMVPAEQNSKRPRQLEVDPPRSTSDDDDDVILIGDEEPKAQEQVVKYPIRIDSKVDWEDKIPIDIISFVDSQSSRVMPKIKGPTFSLNKNIC